VLPSTGGTGNDLLTSSEVPSSWINPTTGIPDQLTFGWVGSTGGSTDYHLVNQVSSDTVSGDPPLLSAALSDSASGHPAHGASMTYTALIGDGSGAGAETQTVTATDTLPSGISPTDTGSGWSGGTDWSCATSGQTITCSDTSGLAAGGTSSLAIPVTVTASGGSHLSDAITVSSVDASAAAATDVATVAANPTSITASASPASASYGATVTLSATGLPAGATGSVSFTSGALTLCTGTVSTGSASCSPGIRPVGEYSVAASYSGDANDGSSQAITSFSITQAVTSFTASSSPSSTDYGSTVELTASGLPTGASGSVTFSGAGTTLCSATLSGGAASCSTGGLAAGSYSVTATYAGDSNYLGSYTDTGFTITPAVTSLTASASPPAFAYGDPVTLSASGLPAGASGYVQFMNGSTTLCLAAVGDGEASCLLSSPLAVGSYSVTASYGGDGNHAGSSASTGFTVSADPILALLLSGMPSGAAQGTGYTLGIQPVVSPAGDGGGPAYSNPTFTAQLPSGESFTSTPSAVGWSCDLGSGNALLTCTASVAPIAAGGALAPVLVGVAISPTAAGSLQTSLQMTDAADQATPFSTSAALNVTPAPGLSVSTTGTPSDAVAGSSYTLTLSPALEGAPAGPAYNGLTLSATLPNGEWFDAAPAVTGWSCSLGTGAASLTCTSTASALDPGTVLDPVEAMVDTAPSATGLLQTSISLGDSADGATPVSATAEVDLTPPPTLSIASSGTPAAAAAGSHYTLVLEPAVGDGGGPAYSTPTVLIELPSGESFLGWSTGAAWSCTASGDDASLSCTLLSAPVTAGTALPALGLTIGISGGASGSEQTQVIFGDAPDLATQVTSDPTVEVTPAPVLGLMAMGQPSAIAANTDYSLSFDAWVASGGGPAYSTLTLSAAVPSGESFTGYESTGDWACARSDGNSLLTCTDTPSSPVQPGSELHWIEIEVQSDGSVLGDLEAGATLSDSTDAAAAADATATVDVTASPLLEIGTSGAPSAASAGSNYTLVLSPALSDSGGPIYSGAQMLVMLDGGETFATTPSASGWRCELADGQTALFCGSTFMSLAAGASMGTVSATVDISPSASGGVFGAAQLSDPEDAAHGDEAFLWIQVTAPPGLDVTVSAPPAVAAGSSYNLQLNPGLAGSGGGPAYAEPTLTTILPAGESFLAAPVTEGWTCSLSVDLSTLTCTSTLTSPIAANSALPSVVATVQVGAASLGTETATASLSDSADLATGATATVSTEVTADPVLQLVTAGTPSGAAQGTDYSLSLAPSLGPAPGGPAYSNPLLTVTLPAGERFSAAPNALGWSCSLGTGGALTCLATVAPVAAGTALTPVVVPVQISAAATGDLETTASLADSGDAATPAQSDAVVDVTGPPLLLVTTSGPAAGASPGTTFSEQVGVQLSPAGGPAYYPPNLSISLSGGGAFAAPPTAADWAFTGGDGTSLTGTWAGPIPITPGTQLASFGVQIKVAGTASGPVVATVGAGDSADGAAPVTATGVTKLVVRPAAAPAPAIQAPTPLSPVPTVTPTLMGGGPAITGWTPAITATVTSASASTFNWWLVVLIITWVDMVLGWLVLGLCRRRRREA
jgi:hypothetical protein